MITFSDQVSIAQGIAGLTDAATTAQLKRDINQGGTMFMAELGRSYNRQDRSTDLEADQQDYQLPEDALRITEVVVNDGTYQRPLLQVPDEFSWRLLNQTTSSGQPTHFFIKGFDVVGLFPKPAETVTDGLTIVFEPKHVLLTQDDFSTGTVAVENDSDIITHADAAFTAAMVGRYFTVAADGKWYRVAAFLSTTELHLENVYQGATGNVTAGNWRIGEVMNIPEEWLEAPVDYAMYRHYLKRGNSARAGEFKGLFKAAVDTARNEYGMTTSSQVIWANNSGSVRMRSPINDNPTTV